MKFLTLSVLLVCAVFALAEDDGKYKPEVTTAAAATTIPTTIRPRWNDPRWGSPAWNDPRWGHNNNNPAWNTWNRYNATAQPGNWNDWRWRNTNQWDTRYNVDAAGRPINRYPDWRTVRLDETANARGYQYDYETVGGIKATEVGTFESFGIRNEGIHAVGSITITDRDGVVYKINYQSESKEAYVPRGAREPERIPPSIVRALALLESHK